MNILLIAQYFPPHQGGIETATFFLAKTLNEEFKHNIVVLTSKYKSANKDHEIINGIHVYRFSLYNPFIFLKHFIPQISNFGIMPTAIFALKKIIKTHKIQVIHAQGRFFLISMVAAILNFAIFKRKFFLSVQERLQFGLSSKVENLFDQIFTMKIYAHANKIITVSNSLFNRLLKFGMPLEKLIYIPNGVEVDLFSKRTKTAYFRKKLNLSLDDKIILVVGRLEKQKGIDYLFQAIPRVINYRPDIRLILVGDGTLKKHLKDLARSLNLDKYIFFMDSYPISVMPQLYQGADFFCLPSIHEGFPLTIIEAMATGLPIIASKIEGIPDAIVEGENGFLVSPKNPADLAQKILNCINLPPESLNKISELNRDKAVKLYSWKNITKLTVCTYLS